MPARVLSIAFAAGLALFSALVVAGFYRAFDLQGRPPALRADYGSWINELIGREDWETLARQLRLSATLDLGEPGVEKEILPNLIRLAHKTGDRENEIFGWRKLAELHRQEPRPQLWLSTAILSAPDASEEELREATFHARLALDLDPASVQARLQLGQLALREPDRADAFGLWTEAQELDPTATERFLDALEQREPEPVREFRATSSRGET